MCRKKKKKKWQVGNIPKRYSKMKVESGLASEVVPSRRHSAYLLFQPPSRLSSPLANSPYCAQ